MTAPYTPMRPLRPRANNAIPDDATNAQAGRPGMRPANTFTGMQQRGIARPAPPQGSSYYQTPQTPQGPTGGAPAAVSPMARTMAAPAAPPVRTAAAPASAPATYTPPTDPNREALTNAVGQYLAQPSAYQSSDLQRDYRTLNDQLALDATAGKRAIDETMAARGLHASTVTGDAYGALEKQQGVTRQQFANNYLDREASDLSTARANAIASALGLQQENADESLAAFGANQAAQQQAHGQAMDIANLGLQTELGRGNLGVSQQQANTAAAAQQATAENQAGQLQLGRDTLTGTLGNQAADRALQVQLQGNELGFNREQLAQTTRGNDLDRALQQMLGLGNLDLQNRELDSSNTNAAADRAQQATLAGNELAFNREQLASVNANSAADRKQAAKLAADQLGLNYAQLTADQQNALADLTLRRDTLNASNTNAGLDRAQQLQLAQMQDTRAGEQIAAGRDAANTQATLTAFGLMGQFGLTEADLPMLIDFIKGKTPPPDPNGNTNTGTNTNPPDSNTGTGEIVEDPNADPSRLDNYLRRYLGLRI